MSRVENGSVGPGLPANSTREPSTRLEIETLPTELVIAATKSEKRLNFLIHVFGKDIVRAVEGGPENQALEAREIVGNKIDYALSAADAIREKSRLQPHERIFKTASKATTIAIAADVINHIGIADGNGKSKIEAQSKPKKPKRLKQVFRTMTEDVYNIEAASEVRRTLGSKDGTTLYSAIRLKPEMRRWLAGEDGTKVYFRTLEQFLNGPIYRSNGITEPPSSSDIAGEIELAVLMRIGAVAEIDRIPVDDPGFEEALENALYLANAGFDRDSLRPYVSDIDGKIHTWPWLQGVMAYALGKTS